MMKLLVIGSAGCIGARRAGLLEEMGHQVIRADKETPLTDDLMLQADAVFICTPPDTHVAIAMQVARLGKPFLLEKPGARTANELAPLMEIVERNQVVSMVACNLRFTNEYAYIKNAIPTIGKPIYAYAECGFYLPFWRPGEYKNYYSCYRSQGGGVLLDSIHELDYLFDLFGNPNGEMALFGYIGNTKELNIEVEDNATLGLVYPNGLTVVLHLDYLQRTYNRKFHCVGTNGAVDMTFNLNKSGLMYRREMSHFLNCVQNKTQTCQTIRDHWVRMNFIDQMKKLSGAPCK